MVDFLAHTSGLANNLHSIPEFHFFQRQSNIFKEVVAYDNAAPALTLPAAVRSKSMGFTLRGATSTCMVRPWWWDGPSHRRRTRPTAARWWS
jgi:hypothetical protein